jgi:hypothetical protein
MISLDPITTGKVALSTGERRAFGAQEMRLERMADSGERPAKKAKRAAGGAKSSPCVKWTKHVYCIYR